MPGAAPLHGNGCGCTVCIPSVKQLREEHNDRALRPCLRCDELFESKGPDNRICRGCKVAIVRHVPTWDVWGE